MITTLSQMLDWMSSFIFFLHFYLFSYSRCFLSLDDDFPLPFTFGNQAFLTAAPAAAAQPALPAPPFPYSPLQPFFSALRGTLITSLCLTFYPFLLRFEVPPPVHLLLFEMSDISFLPVPRLFGEVFIFLYFFPASFFLHVCTRPVDRPFDSFTSLCDVLRVFKTDHPGTTIFFRPFRPYPCPLFDHAPSRFYYLVRWSGLASTHAPLRARKTRIQPPSALIV